MVEIRHAGPGDLGAVVAVMNAWDTATLGEPDTTEADIAAGWGESDFDVAHDAFVATDNGRIVGYAEVYPAGRPNQLDVDVVTHPQAVDAATPPLLDAVLRRARHRAEAGSVLSTWLLADDPRAGPFRAAGFGSGRQFLRMRMDLEGDILTAPTPEGITIVPFRPGLDEATVHNVLLDAFSDHVRPIPAQLDRFLEQHVHHPDFDAELWGVAWEGEHAVGAITVFDHGDLGFIRHIGVRADRRGRGIASALIAWALDLLRRRGQTRADLGVDLEDDVKAAALYEGLGFTTVQRLQLVERRL